MDLALGIAIPFIGTSVGALMVFFMKNQVNPKVEKILLGFASGVMIAASVWSLIIPSIEMAEEQGVISWIPATVGFILGILFLMIIDAIVPHLENNVEKGIKKFKLNKTTMLVLAVTLHNIPEGLSVGLAFGNAFIVGTESAFYLALAVAIGIGIQNFPEGSAISLPMYKEFGSRWKAFLFGMLSGLVEPIMAVAGVFLSSLLTPVLPWLLAFSAGSMMYVVAEELMPESKSSMSSIGTWGFIFGFLLMMILDVALG